MNTAKIQMLSPLQLGDITLQNRMVMAPMTRCRAIGGIPNDLMVTYYEQRSTAGLIITEGTAPSPNGLGYARIPGVYSPEQIAGWKKITEAVHARGGKIVIQLMHVGRIAHSANMESGAKIVAPSAINADSDMWTDGQGMQKTETPAAMSPEELKATQQEFVQAAKNAMEAGFDGVELHSANGYLLEQFLNPAVNVREDAYGGSIENRCRFVLETADAVGKAIGFEKLGIRISPFSPYNSMPAYDTVSETYTHLVQVLNQMGLAYLHIVDYATRAAGSDLLQTLRNLFHQTLILNGGYTKERAEAALENKEADAVSFGSAFIANPDLVYRTETGADWTKPDTASYFTADEKGYTDYPALPR